MIMQVYALTSAHPDDEVEVMYEDISRAMHSSKTHRGKEELQRKTELKTAKFGTPHVAN